LSHCTSAMPPMRRPRAEKHSQNQRVSRRLAAVEQLDTCKSASRNVVDGHRERAHENAAGIDRPKETASRRFDLEPRFAVFTHRHSTSSSRVFCAAA
jgi:hypothetical protein